MKILNRSMCVLLCCAACSPAEPVAVSSARLEPVVEVLSWHEEQLNSAEPDAGDFGYSVAVFQNHSWVGSPGHLVSDEAAGAVFDYARTAGAWQKPAAPILGLRGTPRFGSTMAASEALLAVASFDPAKPCSIWVQDRSDGSVQEVPAPADASSYFGFTLTLLGPMTLFAGDPLASAGAGAVFHFERQLNGEWVEQVPLLPTAADPSYAGFGSALAAAGDLLVIGAPGQAGGGAVYTSQRTGATAFSEPTALDTPEGSVLWGTSVALDDDAETLAVGDRGVADEAGVAHLLSRDGGTAFKYEQTVARSVGEQADEFGQTLALARGILFVGAVGADGTGDGVYTGLVQPFAKVGGAWAASGEPFVPSDGAGSDNFGASLAVSSSGVLLVGARSKVYSYTLALGVACAGDFDCNSGHCVEGVCCNTVCDEGCSSCLAANTAAAHGVDGHCQPVDLDADPKEACETSDETCGALGSCDGRGACTFRRKGVECNPAECSSIGEVGVSRCDGQGACVAPTATPCQAGFSCQEGTCQGTQVEVTTCTASTECDSNGGFYCFEGMCAAGARCSTDKTAAYDAIGTRTECGDLLCKHGGCLETCSESEDCKGGLFCHPTSHQCVREEALVPPAATKNDSGCSMFGRTPTPTDLLLFSLLFLCAARRRSMGARRLRRLS